jgi:hypothetical protein
VCLFSVPFAIPAWAVNLTGNTGPGGIGQLGVAGQGPNMWLDADAMVESVANGAKVNTWTDSSSNGIDATADAASNNTLVHNGRNGNAVINLPAGTSGEFTVPGGVSGISGRTFVGALVVDGNFNCCEGLFGNDGFDAGLRILPNGSGAGYQVSGTTSIGAGGLNINGVNTNLFGAFGNWHDVQAFTHATPQTFTNFMGIGEWWSGRKLQGQLGEVAVYDQILNTAQQQILNSYYGAKYDFSVANDRYTGDDASKGNYDRDVFGIGRVDAGNIYNDADGAGANVGTGSAGLGIAAVDATLGDGEYVLAGHNVAENSIVAVENEDYAMRWERVWYLDTNNSLVDAALSFGFDDGGLSLQFDPAEKEYALLRSLSNDFSSGWEIVSADYTLLGDVVTFNLTAADLIDGYYTLGFNFSPPAPEPGTGLLLALGCVGLTLRRRRKA